MGTSSEIFELLNFPDARGRIDPKRVTPVATLEGLVEIVLLLTGAQAAKLRQKIARVFVQHRALMAIHIPNPLAPFSLFLFCVR